jgi:hypothetical protein
MVEKEENNYKWWNIKDSPNNIAFWEFARKFQLEGKEWTKEISDSAVAKFNYEYYSMV